MKPLDHLPKLTAAGLGAVLLFCLWPDVRLSESPPRPSTATPTERADRRLAMHLAPAAFVGDVPAVPRTSIHSTLRQLLQLQTGDTEGHDRLMKELCVRLTDENAPDILMSLSPEERDTAFGTAALARWLDVDPLAAARWIALQPEATAEQAMIVAQKLAADPVTLRTYCQDLPDGEWKQRILTDAGRTLATNNPTEAIRLAGQMEPGPGRKDLLETAAYAWMTRDTRTALTWIIQHEDPELRESLAAVSAKAIAITSPALAADWLVAAMTPGQLANDTMLSVAEIWGEQDPAGAAAWVTQLADPGPRTAAVDIVLRQWLQDDPVAAINWVQSLPERDTILERLTEAEAGEDSAS